MHLYNFDKNNVLQGFTVSVQAQFSDHSFSATKSLQSLRPFYLLATSYLQAIGLRLVAFYVCCKGRSFENVLEYYYDLGCRVQAREGKGSMEGSHSSRSFKELLWSWHVLARDKATQEHCKCGRNRHIR